MILGDSLQVMASLAEREGLRGKVQCIYLDPPYGIKFNSNFQWSTTSRDVKDGKADHISREPEQVKAFRDTWRDGIHSYLTYLRDRLTVARDLLSESGSIFLQIGDENVHRVRAVMDKVFGDANFVALLIIRKTGSHSDDFVGSSVDYIVWYARNQASAKFRRLFKEGELPPIDEKYYVNVLLPSGVRRRMNKQERHREVALPLDSVVFRYGPITGQGPSAIDETISFAGLDYPPRPRRHWSTNTQGMYRTIPQEPGDPWPEPATTAWNKLGAAETVKAKEAALRSLNTALNRDYTLDNVPDSPLDPWKPTATDLHTQWWEARIARQREIDASIAAKADFEYLYDKPYEDRRKVRVAGPFTVESISPHRVLDVDENDEFIDNVAEARLGYGETQDFASFILEHLRSSGVQQVHKEDRIAFSAITPWPGDLVCAEGRYVEGGEDVGAEKRAAIFIGPEFGTVARPDLVAAARGAADVGFDVLIACAFNYEAHASEFRKLGRVPILKARMNADLHMAGDLKNTGKGNLFVIFGEPDIDVLPVEGNGGESERFQVRINGVDVFHPNSGKIRGDGADGIACWFIDTDYNEESFFVRHAYFLGAGDPYKALKTTLKVEINEEAWSTLRSDTSRPSTGPRPAESPSRS